MRIKLILLILALFIFASQSLYAQETDTNKPDTAVKTLTILGLLKNDVKQSDIMTRAQFTSIIYKISGYTDGGKATFKDVSNDYWAYSEINSVSSMGLMNGTGDGVFEPDNPITYMQATKVLVKILGYEIMAVEKGGWQQGYAVVGGQLGLFKGLNIAYNEQMTITQGARLIYNALNTDILQLSSYGTTSQYSTIRGQTLLTKNLKLFKSNGVINAFGKIANKPGAEVQKGWIKIGGNLYHATNVDASELVGVYVEYYYRENIKDDNEVVAIYVNSGDTQVTTVGACDIDSITSSDDIWTMKFKTENSDVDSIEISRYADIVYNGRAEPNYNLKNLSSLESGSVTFVDNDKDAKIDTVIINEYKSIVVDGVNPGAHTILAKNNTIFKGPSGENSLVVPIDETSATVSIKDKEGVDLALNDIQQWYVVYAKYSYDLTNFELIVTNDFVTGRVEEIGEDEPSRYIKVNGVQYLASRGFDWTENKLSVGEQAIFHLNYDGRFVAVDKQNSSEYKYGYVLKYRKGTGLDTGHHFRLFTEDGVFANFQLADKVILNDINCSDDEAVASGKLTTNTSVVKNQLILYRVNGDNKINSIATAVDKVGSVGYVGYDEDEFARDYVTNSPGIYRINEKVLDDRYVVGAKTVVFKIPQDKTDEDNYSLFNLTNYTDDLSNCNGWEIYGADAYKQAGAVLISGAPNLWDTDMLLVNKVSFIYDAKAGQRLKVTGFLKGKEVEFKVDTNVENRFSTVKSGDILRLNRIYDTILDFVQILSYSNVNIDMPEKDWDSTSAWWGNTVTVLGNVNRKNASVFTMRVNNNPTPLVYAINANTVVYTYRNQNNTFKIASTSDFSIGSRIFVHRRNDAARFVVIYEND